MSFLRMISTGQRFAPVTNPSREFQPVLLLLLFRQGPSIRFDIPNWLASISFCTWT
jgi:hypothetical protein